MRCPFCGRVYDELDQAKVCGACTMMGGCHKTRCPHCGYESPQETRLVRTIKRWMSKWKNQKQTAK